MPCANNFRDRPGLGDATAWSERGVSIEDFVEGAEAARVNLTSQGLQETQCRLAVFVNAKVRQRKGAKQPAPSGALMIGGIAIAGAAAVVPRIAGFTGRQTAEAV